jgi:hypothetical protein
MFLGADYEFPFNIKSSTRTRPEPAMKSFLAACVALTVIAVCAAIILDRFNTPADVAFTSEPSVRL